MNLQDARILVLAESQYQELELWYPVLRFREAGADVVVASPERGGLYACAFFFKEGECLSFRGSCRPQSPEPSRSG